MSILICPVCKKPLDCEGNAYRCLNAHSFDISKYGYVNLLLSQKSSKKRHGDDKQMIFARRSFLSKDYYSPLCDEVCKIAKKYKTGDSFLDTGCGECYYTENIVKSVGYKNSVGIDISKDALRYASKRNKNISLAVASVFDLPIKNESVDLLTNMFAPLASGEFSRVIKKGGVMIRVFPLEKHLLSFKKLIYDEVYLNKIDTLEIEGFSLAEQKDINFKLDIGNNEDIENLFKMTPYYYKTSIKDQQKVTALNRLETSAEFKIAVYIKI